MIVVAEEVINMTPAVFTSTVNTLAMKADYWVGPMRASPVHNLDPLAALFRITFMSENSKGFVVASLINNNQSKITVLQDYPDDPFHMQEVWAFIKEEFDGAGIPSELRDDLGRLRELVTLGRMKQETWDSLEELVRKKKGVNDKKIIEGWNTACLDAQIERRTAKKYMPKLRRFWYDFNYDPERPKKRKDTEF